VHLSVTPIASSRRCSCGQSNRLFAAIDFLRQARLCFFAQTRNCSAALRRLRVSSVDLTGYHVFVSWISAKLDHFGLFNVFFGGMGAFMVLSGFWAPIAT